ncbi:hypothetical protein [Nostoc commune]|uniref:hypothetical protein n=1 Tax=Nostoc commune TaxID=1178 RepID=UPI001C633636|nr:hypothetical protein [Nostoc commune]
MRTKPRSHFFALLPITTHIGHKVGKLTSEEIQYIEPLLSQMEQTNEQVGILFKAIQASSNQPAISTGSQQTLLEAEKQNK